MKYFMSATRIMNGVGQNVIFKKDNSIVYTGGSIKTIFREWLAVVASFDVEDVPHTDWNERLLTVLDDENTSVTGNYADIVLAYTFPLDSSRCNETAVKVINTTLANAHTDIYNAIYATGSTAGVTADLVITSVVITIHD